MGVWDSRHDTPAELASIESSVIYSNTGTPVFLKPQISVSDRDWPLWFFTSRDFAHGSHKYE